MAFVGEAFLSAFIGTLFDKLASSELLKFARQEQVHAEIKKWERMLLKIYAVLEDAEEKQMTNRMGSKIETITARLQDISTQKSDLVLRENAGGSSHQIRDRLPTTSLVVESHVYGRETDKEAIPDMLLKDESTDNEVCIISVVGMGGLGKTTLAQLAYNDDKVKDHFDLRVWAWVCVSDDIEVLRIAKIILQPYLAALENLVICDCDELTSLWENGLGADSLGHLQHLKIQGCPALVSLEEQCLPCSLEYLEIKGCANLEKLPNGLQNLTS
ncbi:hypothetical protein VitviT2T_020317 [Vitis vinifera]|nr:hypothetical protein VitviT2T_020317 [Vitis vinifera]